MKFKFLKILYIPLLTFILSLGSCLGVAINEGETFNVTFTCQGDVISTKSYKKGNIIIVPDPSPIENLVFLGWDYNNDGVVDKIPICDSDYNFVALYDAGGKNYIVNYYDENDNLIKTETVNGGTTIESITAPTKEGNNEYTYEFVGWDCTNDGISEKFPYYVNKNLDFVPVYNRVPVKYNVKYYFDDVLLQDKEVDYGTKSTYDKDLFYLKGDGYYYYITGFDSDNDSLVDNNIITNNTIYKALYTKDQICVIHINNEIYVYYVEPGDSFNKLTGNEYLNKTINWYTDSEMTDAVMTMDMPTGYFEVYGYITNEYNIDCSLLEYSKVSKVSSRDELTLLINYLLFTRTYSHTVTLNYSFDDINTEINEATKNKMIDITYSLTTSYNKITKQLSFDITYGKINYLESTAKYTYYDCANNLTYPNSRGETFNDFYIEGVSKSFSCANSEQLYYCLEHGYRPVIYSSNTSLISLYDAMKDVLRTIITDDMSDYTKALAIYEWICHNVTYDNNMIKLVNDGADCSGYHSFYLEGVFNYNLAVCDGISKAYAALCNMEGIKCLRVTGKGSQNHAWNKVLINGKWYIVDATSGGTIVGDKQITSHKFFMVTDEFFSQFYIELDNPNSGIECNSTYSYYENTKVTLNGTKYSLCVNSKQDLANLFKWFKTFNTTNITFDCYINFDIGTNIDDEISYARTMSGLGSLTYVYSNNVLVMFV